MHLPCSVTAQYKVCTSWHAVSTSESLWRRLCWSVFKQDRPAVGFSWAQTYLCFHKTASNFYRGNAEHVTLDYEASSDSDNGGSICRRLALSSDYLAGGFSDGAVRVFDLQSKECMSTLAPIHENRIGSHSRNIAGISLAAEADAEVVFASMDGCLFAGDVVQESCRRVHEGDYVNDGILVDFTGSQSYWVGLYAGARGRALHVWDAYTEVLVFSGGDMTDADAYRGWHLLIDNADHIGRVRISQDQLAVIATRSKLCVVDLRSLSIVFHMPMPSTAQALSTSLAVHEGRMLIVCTDGLVRVLSSDMLQEIWRDNSGRIIPGSGRQVNGAMNSWHVVICRNGVVDIWDAFSGVHLYALSHRLSDVQDLASSNGYIAVCCGSEEGIHLWDFSP